MESDRHPDEPPATTRRVIVLSRDLFFGMRIRNALKQMGYATIICKTETGFADEIGTVGVSLGLVDFNTPVDWETTSAAIESPAGVPVIAFGPHTDTDGFLQARAAGVSRVIANGAFSQQLPDLIEKYAIDP